MPGYERERIIGVNNDVLDEFTCNLCQKIFVNPVTTECCGQTYCKECIRNWLNINKVCPNDRRPLQPNCLLQTPKFVLNILNNMKLKCVYYGEGCPVVKAMNELGKHVYNCDYKPKLLCKTCGYEVNANGVEHNCIRNLLNKNSAKNEENNRLEERVRSLEAQLKSVLTGNNGNMNDYMLNAQNSSLVSARNNLDQCLNLHSSNNVTNEMCSELINKCKEAILMSHSFTAVAEHIVASLERDKTFRKTKWTVVVNVYQSMGMKANHHYCQCLGFGSLTITIMGFK